MEDDFDVFKTINEIFEHKKEEDVLRWLVEYMLADKKRLKDELLEANVTISAIRKIANGASSSDIALIGIKALVEEG